MTPEELQARNAANAAHSTGPKTEEGKRKSSLNSLRHGLTGQVIVCRSDEELAAYQKHCAAIMEEYKPEGPTEIFFTAAVADDMWRLQVTRAIESATFGAGYFKNLNDFNTGAGQVDESFAQAKTWEQQGRSLSTLSQYERRFRCSLKENLKELRELQRARRAAYGSAREEALRQMALAESDGQTYEPGEDFLPASAHGGFVFSRPEMLRYRDLKFRSARAWNLSRNL